MTHLRKVLLPAILAAAVIVPFAVSQAQQGPAPGAPPEGGRGPRPGFAPPSPETMQRMQEGRLAAARAALRLTEAQQKLWAPIEDHIKQGFAARQQRMKERREAGAPRAGAEQALPERLDRMSQMMSEQAARTKALSELVKPLYATLSDEQKAVLGPVMRQLAGMGMGPGRGHGGGMGGHRGPRWPGEAHPRQ